jgi:hypothetical protein
MGESAFDVLIIPILWATFAGIVAGAAVLALINAVEAIAGHFPGPRTPPAGPIAARFRSRPSHRSPVHGAGSSGGRGSWAATRSGHQCSKSYSRILSKS